jgi:serine/threonine protein kinase
MAILAKDYSKDIAKIGLKALNAGKNDVFVLSLARQLCPDKIPVPTGERLGHDGADGETFEVANDPGKAIKFSIIYDRFPQPPLDIYYRQIIPILDYVMTTRPPMCAHVYEHGYLGEYSRPMPHWRNGVQSFVIHYCIMEKLFSLTEDEKKVLHSLVSHEDRNIKKDLSSNRIKEMLGGLACGLDFDSEMVILFCNHLREASLEHLDIHVRNIMKDASGQFKLIDFDRAILEK